MAQDILAMLIKKPCCVGWTDKIYFAIRNFKAIQFKCIDSHRLTVFIKSDMSMKMIKNKIFNAINPFEF